MNKKNYYINYIKNKMSSNTKTNVSETDFSIGIQQDLDKTKINF